MSPSRGPLAQSDYETINRQLAQISQTQADISRALAAGCPVEEQSEMCNNLRAAWEKIKRAYFPDKP
jgi:hypothetical protein